MTAIMNETVARSAFFGGRNNAGPKATDLSPALRAVILAAGKDDMLPTLTGVRVELPDGGGVRFSATDRFRLHSAGVGCDPMPDDSAPYVNIPAKSLKPFVSGWKASALGPNGLVSLRFAGSGLEVVTDGKEGTTSTVLAGLEGEYPKLGSLLDSLGNPDTSGASSAGFDPGYLADAVTAAGYCRERNTPVRVSIAATRKPARVDIAPDSAVRFVAIVMPVTASWIDS